MSSETAVTLPIDKDFNVTLADQLAKYETYNKHYYRPNSYLHKWWARRCGSTFRTILKHLVEAESQQDYYSPQGLEGKIILDPMMGGGTTIHEAIRLGANVIGIDIDPIPILQARASLTHIPLHTLETHFNQLHQTLQTQLAPLFTVDCPICQTQHILKYQLYGWRRQCACQTVLTVDNHLLRRNPDGSEIRLDPATGDIYKDDQCLSHRPHPMPVVTRKEKQCPHCQQPFKEDKTTPFYQRYEPIALVVDCPQTGLTFLAPQAQHAIPRPHVNPDHFQVEGGYKSRVLHHRGITNYLDLFTNRQLHYIGAMAQQLATYPAKQKQLFALLLSTSLEFNSLLCGYKGTRQRRPGTIRHVFAHHGYYFPSTALENNPLYPDKSSGTLQNLFYYRVLKGQAWAEAPIEREILGTNGRSTIHKRLIPQEKDHGQEVFTLADLQTGSQKFMLHQGSAIKLPLPDNSVHYIVTDPPYFDSVQYSDLAAFFRVWLKQLLPNAAEWEYDMAGSAVDQRANGHESQYLTVLGGIFKECARVMKANGRLIFTFHHWNPKGWSDLTLALRRAGFELVNQYVLHAENMSSVHIANQKSLVHDVILVLAQTGTQRDEPWQLPSVPNLQESQSFCDACGTAVGYFLQAPLTEPEIINGWQQFLQPA